MRGAWRAGAAAATLAVSGALTGCGGTSAKHDEAAKSPQQIAAQVTSYANRWLKLPTASNPSFAADLARQTNLGIELRCWAARKSGLSVAGTGSVGGRSAVIVASDGSVPGSAPGRVYVAATGPAWPLRAVVSGPRQPGGSGACAEPTTPRTSDITISDFNRPIALKAPPSPLDPDSLRP